MTDENDKPQPDRETIDLISDLSSALIHLSDGSEDYADLIRRASEWLVSHGESPWIN